MNEWATRRLGDLAELRMGQAPPSQYVTGSSSDQSIPFLQGNADFGRRTPRPKVFCSRPARTSHPGDILISVRAPVGELNLSDEVYCIGRGLAAVGFTGLDPGFGWHELVRAAPSLHSVAHGSTFTAIGRRELEDLALNVPPIQAQRKIAEILDTVDESINSSMRLIAKLKSVRLATVAAMFAGLIERGCEVRRLDELADVDRGKFSARPRNDPRFYGGAYPFIQTGDVRSADGLIISSASQSLNESGRAVSREFPYGTIAVTIAANIADTAILGKPMCFPDSVVGVVVSPFHVTRFVELAIRLAKPRLEARAPQSAQKNINLQDLRPLDIPVPPRRVQEQIARIYEALEQREQAASAEAAKLKTVKQGLMEDLLTGRVRVKVD